MLFAGGTTGGHLMPGVALAEALQKMLPQSRAMFLRCDRDAERNCSAAVGAFETASVPDTPWHGGSQRLLFPGRFLHSAERVLQVVGQFRPHVMIGLGSYNSAAPVLVARWLGLPTALLEANAKPGRAVRMLAPLVDVTFVAWAEAIRELPCRRAVAWGLPVRRRLFTGRRPEAARSFGLDPDVCTVLALGGSQGARAINRHLPGAVGRLRARGFDLQVVHIAGPAHADAVRRMLPHECNGYRVVGFLDRMEDAYAAADFIVSRAGSTISELAALGLPSVLIPYPHAADDHQQANARIMRRGGAATVLPQSELTEQSLAEVLVPLATDRDLRRRMADRARQLGRPQAAFHVAGEIAGLAGFASCVDSISTHPKRLSQTPTQAA